MPCGAGSLWGLIRRGTPTPTNRLTRDDGTGRRHVKGPDNSEGWGLWARMSEITGKDVSEDT